MAQSEAEFHELAAGVAAKFDVVLLYRDGRSRYYGRALQGDRVLLSLLDEWVGGTDDHHGLRLGVQLLADPQDGMVPVEAVGGWYHRLYGSAESEYSLDGIDPRMAAAFADCMTRAPTISSNAASPSWSAVNDRPRVTELVRQWEAAWKAVDHARKAPTPEFWQFVLGVTGFRWASDKGWAQAAALGTTWLAKDEASRERALAHYAVDLTDLGWMAASLVRTLLQLGRITLPPEYKWNDKKLRS